MPDAYLLLTPVLLLAVFALTRFVGCDRVFTVPDVPEAPSNLQATPSDHAVDLSWDPSPNFDGPYRVKSGETSGGPYPNAHDTPNTIFTDEGLVNGTTLFYVVVAVAGRESSPSNEVEVVPAQALVISVTLGDLRNDFNGFVGMLIRVAAKPLLAVGLQRMKLDGTANLHQVKIVDASTNVDVPNASVIVDLTAPTAKVGKFVKGLFVDPITLTPKPITLTANTEYYIVSSETAGADQWADHITQGNLTTVGTTGDAVVESAVFGDGIATYTRAGNPGQTLGPVNVLY